MALSADGNTGLIGGPTDQPGGAAWVFVQNGDVWTQQGAKLVVSGPLLALGSSVALSADGSTALIGAVEEAFVFTRNGGAWNLAEDLTITSPGNTGSVALSADGNTALVGKLAFGHSGSVWSWQGALSGSSNRSVALSADGYTAVLGGLAADPSSGGFFRPV